MAFSHCGTLLFAFPIIMLYGATMVMTWTVAGALIQSIVPALCEAGLRRCR